jgi:dTDP-4-amino-4,6-dideoxygalactose transaminase
MVPSLELPVVPLNDLKRTTSTLRQEIRDAIGQVLASGWYLFGPQVANFESAFAAYCGVSHCISVANGTDALEIGLRALGCGPGDEVVTVANAGMYGSAAIVTVGAHPIFADIDPITMTMDRACLEVCLGPKTRAIIVTHLYGRLADIEAMEAIAQSRGIPIIEDCAQAHGAQRAGRKAGSWGALGCYSFYPTKNLGAFGDGGAIVTNSDELAAESRSLRQYGWKEKYIADRLNGRNSRLDELQAAVLLAKLPHLDGWNARRREIVGRYRQAAGGGLTVPDTSGADHVAHLCVVRSPERNRLRNFLYRIRVATDIHYPVPDHRQPALQSWAGRDTALPVTDAVVKEIVTLPCFPELSDEEIARVCDGLARFAGGDR